MHGELRVHIVATHPIQYHVPWFQALARHGGIRLKVYFGALPTPQQQGQGFGQPIDWGISLLEGYEWESLEAASPEAEFGRFVTLRSSRVGRVLRRDSPSALILTGWHSLLLLQFLAAALARGIPTLVRGESNALRFRPWYVRVLHRILLGRYDAYLCIGRENRRFYEGYGIPAERMFPVPYFVDNDRFAAQTDALRGARDAIRREWGIAPETACFLFAGKLEPKKRPLDFLLALGLAAEHGARVHALVVGAGALEPEAQALCREKGIAATFTGFLNQKEISRAYAAADCFVLPSDYGETWGLVVNEAMASGLPAIVSDRVGCGPDLIVTNQTGAVFPFGATAALAQKMAAYAGDRQRLREMGARARERVLRDYSVEKAVEGTIKAVRYVVGDR